MLTRTRDSLTTVTVERTSVGRVRVGLDARSAPERPVLRPMLIASSDDHARVSLVPEGALLLAGDAVRIEVHVGPGAALELVEPAGTVAYDMRGDRATWDVEITLAEAARLTWLAEPFVSSAGSDVVRTTSIDRAEGATCTLQDTVVLGRHGESSGRLRQTLTSDLLVEDLELGHPLLLGGSRVMRTLLTLGERSECGMQLEGEGTLLRELADHAHLLGAIPPAPSRPRRHA